MIDNEELRIECDCGDYDHAMAFSFWPPDDINPAELFMLVRLNPIKPWYRRIGIAIKYVFGWRSNYGDYAELVVSYNSAIKIILWLNKRVKMMHSEWKNNVN